MLSAPNEEAAVLPNLASVDRPWHERAEGRRRQYDGLGRAVAVWDIPRHARAHAILVVVVRVLIVFGVLAALGSLI